MSALDAFLATWTTARVTFGSGEPQTGEQFDGSRQLEELRAAVHTAAPGGHWSGGAATAYDGKNAGHAGVIGRLAGLDMQLGAYVTESARVVSAGRKNLDTIRSWVLASVDYENGLVVMRQNPSVELAADGGPGQVRVGVPEAVIQQTSDGAVRIKFEAANPFAPDIAQNPPWPLEDNPWTVNGDLVFTPGSDGVRVDGTRTNYPSMEVYQDFPDGSSRTVLIDPAIAGNSTGPMVNSRSTTTSAKVESLSHPLTPVAGILTSTSESRCPLQSSARRQVRRVLPPPRRFRASPISEQAGDMTARARLNGMDSRAWSTATWSAPFVTQLVLALTIVISWLLGKQFPGTPGFALFLVGAATILPPCVVSSGLLIRSAS